jgi:hypothetical protein
MGTFPGRARSVVRRTSRAHWRTASPTSGLPSWVGCTGPPHRTGANHGCRRLRQQKGPRFQGLSNSGGTPCTHYRPLDSRRIASEVGFVAGGSQLDDGLAISGAGLRLAQDGGRLLERDPRDRRRKDPPGNESVRQPREELGRGLEREVDSGDSGGRECVDIGDVLRRDGSAPERTSEASPEKASAWLTRSMSASMPSGCACRTASGSETAV